MKRVTAFLLLATTVSCNAMHHPMVTQEYKKSHTSIDAHAWYALHNMSNVGYVTWAENEILELSVVEKYRTKGIGGYLFCRALADIKKNHDYAHWYAVDSVSFYRRFGAQPIDQDDITPETAHMMFDFKLHGDPVARYTAYANTKLISKE